MTHKYTNNEKLLLREQREDKKEIDRLSCENKKIKIAFGKYIAGHRPGEELWSKYDDEVLGDLSL